MASGPLGRDFVETEFGTGIRITFAVSGPGQLVGVDNGDPTDTTSYKGSSRKAFSGKALAIVRATTSAGSIVVKASASGLSADPITVNSQ
jgi:beta-galactosidase